MGGSAGKPCGWCPGSDWWPGSAASSRDHDLQDDGVRERLRHGRQPSHEPRRLVGRGHPAHRRAGYRRRRRRPRVRRARIGSGRVGRRPDDLLQLGRFARGDVRERCPLQHTSCRPTGVGQPAGHDARDRRRHVREPLHVRWRASLETDAATYESRCTSDGERAELHLAPVRSPAPVPGLAIAPGERQAALGTVGVPHLVVLVADVELVDVVSRGRLLRSDPVLGPAGANVNFISPAGRASEWRMRTYERGVEDETLACGTGAVAAACALADWGLAKLPVTFWTRSAKRLEIRARKTPEGLYDDVWLGGEARLVVRGVIN